MKTTTEEGKNYKVKDLPADFNFAGCKLGERFIVSGWSRGFWLSDNFEDYKKVEPIFFSGFEEIKNWKIKVPKDRVLPIELEKHRQKVKGKK